MDKKEEVHVAVAREEDRQSAQVEDQPLSSDNLGKE